MPRRLGLLFSAARLSTAASLLFVLVGVPVASASYVLASNAASPSLRVNAAGVAEVSWSSGGSRLTFVVGKSGPGYHGTVAGADVSKRASSAVPMAVALRRTPDGTLWALQQRTAIGRPTSLDLSRWRGDPTRLTLATDGRRISGSVTFHGKPVTGSSPTPGGKNVRTYVFLECYGCPAQPKGWIAMLGVAPKADGTFAVYLRPSWVGSRYRATVAGPNVGSDLAPDAQAFADAPG